MLSDQAVVARHPVSWVRIIAVCIAGSLLLTGLYVWQLRDYVDQRRGVRDTQYQRTQEELDLQRQRIEQLDRDQAADGRRIDELERRLKVTPTVAP